MSKLIILFYLFYLSLNGYIHTSINTHKGLLIPREVSGLTFNKLDDKSIEEPGNEDDNSGEYDFSVRELNKYIERVEQSKQSHNRLELELYEKEKELLASKKKVALAESILKYHQDNLEKYQKLLSEREKKYHHDMEQKIQQKVKVEKELREKKLLQFEMEEKKRRLLAGL
ncbi:hypothetical protein K502DRAFT_333333 [Neoconidiobolus thromboides FSU 785]|nr:hypothetical protein K502DRAFT_333333 [Neoconidiobolus thromboides FSU 785]